MRRPNSLASWARMSGGVLLSLIQPQSRQLLMCGKMKKETITACMRKMLTCDDARSCPASGGDCLSETDRGFPLKEGFALVFEHSVLYAVLGRFGILLYYKILLSIAASA